MTTSLYTLDILRLATAVAHYPRLSAPDATVERRAPVCGSRITVDLALTAAGAVSACGLEVRACALGQASAALLAQHIIGRTAADIDAARARMASYLAGAADTIGDWPDLALLADVRRYPARHGSVLLAFEAAADAAAMAQTVAA